MKREHAHYTEGLQREEILFDYTPESVNKKSHVK